MQRPRHDNLPSPTRSSCLDERQFYCLRGPEGYLDSVLYQVIPAGKNFFHIIEVTSGRIKGFRSDHIQACELAKQLETLLQAPRDRIVSSAG